MDRESPSRPRPIVPVVTPARAVIELRAERPADCRAVATVHIAAWRAGYADIVDADVLDALDLDAWTHRREQYLAASDHRQRTLVAELDSAIVGHVTFGRCRAEPAAPVGEIWACYVHPDWWGKGVGDRLLTAALADLPDREVRLWVLEDNHRARAFYHRHGFRPDGACDLYRSAGSTAAYPEVRYTLHRP